MIRILKCVALAGALAGCSFAHQTPVTRDNIDDPGVGGPYSITFHSGVEVVADEIESRGDTLLIFTFKGSRESPFGGGAAPDTSVARVPWSEVKSITAKKWTAGTRTAEGFASAGAFALMIGVAMVVFLIVIYEGWRSN